MTKALLALVLVTAFAVAGCEAIQTYLRSDEARKVCETTEALLGIDESKITDENILKTIKDIKGGIYALHQACLLYVPKE